MVPEPLSNYLRMHRKRSGLAQHELARLLGAKEGSKVSRYERGDRFPSFDALLGYEILFEAPTQRLFAGESRRARVEIRKRANALFLELDAKRPETATLRRKKDFLVGIINASTTYRS